MEERDRLAALTVQLPVGLIMAIKRAAITESMTEGRRVTNRELIQRALREAYAETTKPSKAKTRATAQG